MLRFLERGKSGSSQVELTGVEIVWEVRGSDAGSRALDDFEGFGIFLVVGHKCGSFTGSLLHAC